MWGGHVGEFTVLRLCRAVDRTSMSYHQVVCPQCMCTCVSCDDDDDDDVCVIVFASERKDQSVMSSNINVTKITDAPRFLSVCPQTVLQKGHVRRLVLRLLVSQRLHTHSPPPNPKALCADNPNQWYGLFYLPYILIFCLLLLAFFTCLNRITPVLLSTFHTLHLSDLFIVVYPRWLHVSSVAPKRNNYIKRGPEFFIRSQKQRYFFSMHHMCTCIQIILQICVCVAEWIQQPL